MLHHYCMIKAFFTVLVSSVIWPLDKKSGVEVEFVSIQTSLLFISKCKQVTTRKAMRLTYIKTKPTSASLLFKGLINKQRTAKYTMAQLSTVVCFSGTLFCHQQKKTLRTISYVRYARTIPRLLSLMQLALHSGAALSPEIQGKTLLNRPGKEMLADKYIHHCYKKSHESSFLSVTITIFQKIVLGKFAC